MTILIVEDHRATADCLSKLLSGCSGITTIGVARTLAEGISKSLELKPDITLLDLILPDSPTWQATVAAIHEFKPPVIVITELSDPEINVAAYKAGAEDVMHKGTVLKIASILIAAIASAKMRRLARDTKEDGQ